MLWQSSTCGIACSDLCGKDSKGDISRWPTLLLLPHIPGIPSPPCRFWSFEIQTCSAHPGRIFARCCAHGGSQQSPSFWTLHCHDLHVSKQPLTHGRVTYRSSPLSLPPSHICTVAMHVRTTACASILLPSASKTVGARPSPLPITCSTLHPSLISTQSGSLAAS